MFNSCLTAIKTCNKVLLKSIRIYYWLKYSGEILDEIKARDFNTTGLPTYDFYTLHTALPHTLIKDSLIERTFQRDGSTYLACNESNMFFTSEQPKNIMHGHAKMYVMR